MSQVMSRDWFESLFGFEEKSKSYEEIQASFEVLGEKLRSKVNNREFIIGQFSTPTLQALRKEGRRLLQGCERKSVQLSHVATPDILTEHGKPENQHALFQVASQFNCLEFVSPARVPEHGVTCYDLDNTQGPACAIAAGAATVFRNYFVPIPPPVTGSPQVACQFGQTKELQIDTLDCLALELKNQEQRFWVLKNGYINSSTSKLDRLNPYLDPTRHDLDVLRQLIKVGLHQDVQVTAADEAKPIQVVSQVFCSAVGVSYTLARAEEWRPLALLVLEAAYEATLWVAVLNFFQKKVVAPVFLTLVGGGAFGNPPGWIAYALARAVAVLEHEGAGSLLDCRLVHFLAVDQRMVEIVTDQLVAERLRVQDE